METKKFELQKYSISWHNYRTAELHICTKTTHKAKWLNFHRVDKTNNIVITGNDSHSVFFYNWVKPIYSKPNLIYNNLMDYVV